MAESDPNGCITNLGLEVTGLLLLRLVMEKVCDMSDACHCALFSDNQPIFLWVRQMIAKSSLIAAQLLRALALQLKLKNVSPLTPLHIQGKENSITDIPSRSFGSDPTWYCKTDADLLTLFNNNSPSPSSNLGQYFTLLTI